MLLVYLLQIHLHLHTKAIAIENNNNFGVIMDANRICDYDSIEWNDFDMAIYLYSKLDCKLE